METPTLKQISGLLYRLRSKLKSDMREDVEETLKQLMKRVENQESCCAVISGSVQFGNGSEGDPLYMAFSSEGLVRNCSKFRETNVKSVMSIDGKDNNLIIKYIINFIK